MSLMILGFLVGGLAGTCVGLFVSRKDDDAFRNEVETATDEMLAILKEPPKPCPHCGKQRDAQ